MPMSIRCSSHLKVGWLPKWISCRCTFSGILYKFTWGILLTDMLTHLFCSLFMEAVRLKSDGLKILSAFTKKTVNQIQMFVSLYLPRIDQPFLKHLVLKEKSEKNNKIARLRNFPMKSLRTTIHCVLLILMKLCSYLLIPCAFIPLTQIYVVADVTSVRWAKIT